MKLAHNAKSPDRLLTIRAFKRIIRQRSTLPHSLPCSTIDAKELNFRVRDGYGCDLFAIATRLKWSDPELLNAIKSYMSNKSCICNQL